jgi:hypothetical protein
MFVSRVMVECRYPKTLGTVPSVASVGYMVKSPSVTFPSKVTSKGLFGVELRIAEGIWLTCKHAMAGT